LPFRYRPGYNHYQPQGALWHTTLAGFAAACVAASFRALNLPEHMPEDEQSTLMTVGTRNGGSSPVLQADTEALGLYQSRTKHGTGE